MAAERDTQDAPDLTVAPVAEPGSSGASVERASHVEPVTTRDQDLSIADFTAVMLRALIDMAARSQRRQADLLAALRGADLPADPVRVRAALRVLLAQQCVTNLVPLSDGGMLLTVTRQAMERAGPAPQWLPLEELDPADGADRPREN